MPPLGFPILFPLLFLLLGGIFEFPAELPFAAATIHKNICLLPPDTGPCLASFRRWYFSPRMRRCLPFSYGGCQGNANNFETLEACERRCQDSPSPQLKPGACPLVVEHDSRMCGRFCSTDNSCPGSERCCKTSCGQECQIPLEDKRGYCPRASVRPGTLRRCLSTCVTDEDCGWGIRIPARKCCTVGCQQMCMEAEEEHPGLCPKRDVVQTFVPCHDTCHDDRDCPFTQKCCFTGCSLGCLNSVRSDQCQLPPEKGPCRARIRRFYYSPSQKKCLRFFYGGCGGNSNNFMTKKECEGVCGEINPEVCKQPKGNGECLAYSEFFHYNSTSHTCEKSTFCDCKTEANRFTTKLECLMVCGNSTKSDKE